MRFYSIFIVALLLFPIAALAHQPRIVDGELTSVPDPEVSKAFYGKLSGEPHVFVITESAPFELYVNVLVPDGATTDVSAAIINQENPDEPIAMLPAEGAWERYHEVFAQDWYLKGPEFRTDVPAGTYEIRVWSSNNVGRYVLAVGEKERFPLSEIIHTYRVIPMLKTDFFGKPAYEAYLTPILGIPLGVVGVCGLFAYLAYRMQRNRRAPTI